ncbi:MAG: OmpA family protein [Myxococcota bacterium]
MALAQTAPTADLEQVWLDPSGRGSLFVGNGQTLPALTWRVGAAGFYTYGNLRSLQGSSTTMLLQDRLGFQVFAAVGLLDWLEVSANLPVLAFQQGNEALNVAPAGLGNPWLHGKVNLLDEHMPVSLAIDLGIGIPVGTGVAQGNGGFEFAPKVQVGKVFDAWQVGGELGFLFRPTTDFKPVSGVPNDLVGSQLWLAGMVTAVNPSGPRGEFTLRLFAPLTGTGRAGVEGQLGVRWDAGPVELYASAGPGFFGESTTPSVRVYLGGAFANVPMTQPPCVEGQPYEVSDCPDLDRDQDGIKNGVDRAPEVAEDKDGFEDEDGAPDFDNDGDGVPDEKDKCRDVAGPEANQGCPDADADKDGVVDRLDKCPNDAEDKDDFEDSDGCPELDNDKDGFADGADACPQIAGIAQERGCPAKDSDGDQVSDHEDNCPTEPGTKENYGCPAARKQLVVITRERLQILDKVYFDTGKATIQKRSNALLDNVAAVLTSHPEISLVQVEGHTDNTGNADKNKKLSQDRADSVKAYLVKAGVADARLRAVGFGQDKPAQPNDTPAGRDANRRVEFNLVQQ